MTDAAVAATCATAGKTEGSHCSVCGTVIVAQTVIPATGKHTFTEYAQNDADTHLAVCSVCGDVVEEAHSFTASVSGDTTTYTCSKCGYSYTSTAARCTVSFSVPTGVSAVASIDSVGGASITLPTAGDVSGYTFCGWTTAAVDPESTSKPTVLTGSYQPTADITLYALYSRTVSGSGSTGYARFTGSSIENGDYVIVSAATGSALTASAANNWLKAGSTYPATASPPRMRRTSGRSQTASSPQRTAAAASTQRGQEDRALEHGQHRLELHEQRRRLDDRQRHGRSALLQQLRRLASVFRRLRLGQDLRPVPRGRGLHDLLHNQPDQFPTAR